MRRILLFCLALAWAAGAGPARADGAAAWDDSHMRSNWAHQRGPAPPRPPIQGASRYERANEDPAPTPPTTVSEQTLRISPHAWRAGGGGGGASSSAPPWASPTRSGGGVGPAAPTVSSGIRNADSGIRRTSTSGASTGRRSSRR